LSLAPVDSIRATPAGPSIAMRPALALLRLAGTALAAAALAACSPIGLVATATGVATDSGVTWEVVKHVHGKLTEDDPMPCALLNGVQRALNARCDYAPGRIRRADFATAGLQECAVGVATRDPRLWRSIPELLDKGPGIDTCRGSPLVALAASEPCPDFAAASPAVRDAIRTLAETDPRAIRHDVFRMLGCPRARAVGLDRVLLTWLDRGDLEPGKLSFSPLGAADPELLVTRFGRELEVAGHKAETALDGYDGTLPSGFEEALRDSRWAAIEWWLYRLPQLANLAPPQRGGQLGWVPLQRVLLPGFLRHPETQRDMVGFLLAHGADPNQKLPFDRNRTVIGFAAQINSPMRVVLEARSAAPKGTAAATLAAMQGGAAAPRRAPPISPIAESPAPR
jgi:hypothetical protein